MSEQDQGAPNAAPPQPRAGSLPPLANADPPQAVGEPEDQVDEVRVDTVPPALEGHSPEDGEPSPDPDPGAANNGPDPGEADPLAVVDGEGEAVMPVPVPVRHPDAGEPDLEPVVPDPVVPQPQGLSADAQAAVEVVRELAAAWKTQAERADEQLAALAEAQQERDAQAKVTQEQLTALAAGIAEGNRLRSRDQAHVEQLHTDNTALRRGELTSAMAPLLSGLVRLSDQMASMAAGDKHSIAGMLRVQLLQTMDVGADVTEFAPADGEAFDSKRMTGAGREDTRDPDQDGTVCRTVRSGFARGDGSIVRVAEVVVRRLAPTPRPAGAGSEQ